MEAGGEEEDDEEKLDLVQVVGKSGGVKTRVTESRIQQL